MRLCCYFWVYVSIRIAATEHVIFFIVRTLIWRINGIVKVSFGTSKAFHVNSQSVEAYARYLGLTLSLTQLTSVPHQLPEGGVFLGVSNVKEVDSSLDKISSMLTMLILRWTALSQLCQKGFGAFYLSWRGWRLRF